jgi:hypothetical protein
MPDPSTCPLCDEPCWPSFRQFDAYAAQCGTLFTTTGTVNQSVTCRTIQGLRLDAGINELLKETA